MVCLEDDFPSPAVKTPTTFGDEDESVLEKAPSYVIEFADNLLQVAKLGDRRTTSQLVNLLIDTSYDMNILRRSIESVADREGVTSRITWKLTKNSEFRRVPVRKYSRKRDGCRTLYVKI